MGAEREAVEALAAAWDAEPDGVWQPPGQPRFEVGDRVRIRVSGECRKQPDRDADQAADGILGHAAWEDGLLGTVLCTRSGNPQALKQGHPIGVEWDRAPAWVRSSASHYAACELIPLADADDEMPSGCSTAGQQATLAPAQVSTAPDGDSEAVGG